MAEMESAPFLDMSHDLDQLQGFLLSSNPLGFFQLQKPIQRVPTGNFLQRFLSWIRFRIKKKQLDLVPHREKQQDPDPQKRNADPHSKALIIRRRKKQLWIIRIFPDFTLFVAAVRLVRSRPSFSICDTSFLLLMKLKTSVFCASCRAFQLSR